MKKILLALLFCAGLATLPFITARADDTPTPTPTPTDTPTPTNTPTPNYTVVNTNTPTATRTRTATRTLIPGRSITWVKVDTVSPALLNGMTNYLLANQPEGEDGTVYTVTDTQANGTGSYIISIVNITGAAPDYTWGLDSGGYAWIGSLICSQAVEWECQEYTLEQIHTALSNDLLEGIIQNAYEGVLLPWQAGKKAVYGISGVHGADSGWLPGSRAVDFLGGDTMGSDIMPPYAYAAADGIVTYTCHGTNDTSILVDSGNAGRFLYAHLNRDDPALVNGLEIHAGQPISSLTYGTFSGGPCGTWASQQATQYHLHFAFMPSNGYLLIGPCQLNISSQQFLCGGVTYAVGSRIPNGGNAPPPNGTVTPCAGDGCVPPSYGGDHIWNGPVNLVNEIINYLAQNVLGPHTASGLATELSNLVDQVGDIAMLLAASQLLEIVPAVVCYGAILLMELIRLVVVAWRWILRVIPLAG